MRVVGILNHFLLPSMLIAIFIWGIWHLFSYIKKRKIDIKVWVSRYIFITYLVGVLLVTEGYKVFVEGFPTFFMEANLIPFVNTIQDIMNNPLGTIELIVYNIILFIPFGFLIVTSFPDCKWNVKRITIVSFLGVLVVETLEYLSGRYMDIDDIIINICGSLLGYAVYKLLTIPKHMTSI